MKSWNWLYDSIYKFYNNFFAIVNHLSNEYMKSLSHIPGYLT